MNVKMTALAAHPVKYRQAAHWTCALSGRAPELWLLTPQFWLLKPISRSFANFFNPSQSGADSKFTPSWKPSGTAKPAPLAWRSFTGPAPRDSPSQSALFRAIPGNKKNKKSSQGLIGRPHARLAWCPAGNSSIAGEGVRRRASQRAKCEP